MSKAKKNIIIFTAIGLLMAISIACFCCIKFVRFDSSTITLGCKDSITLNVGDSLALNVECSVENAKIELTTENTDVVIIEDVNITAISSGIAYVKVKATANNTSGSKNVKVIVRNEDLGVTLSKETTLYLIDKKETEANKNNLFNSIEYSTNDGVSFSLSDEQIVSVSKRTNKITAKKEGTVTITFYSTVDPTIRSSHVINVLAIPPVLNISLEEISLEIGEEQSLEYTLSPVYYTGSAEIEFNIQNSEIANYIDGKVTALRAGTTQLNIYLNGSLCKEISVNITEPYIPTYSFNVSAIANCRIEENTIYTASSSFSLKILVVNELNEIQDCEIEITDCTSPAIIGGNYIFASSCPQITISAMNISKTFSVVQEN